MRDCFANSGGTFTMLLLSAMGVSWRGGGVTLPIGPEGGQIDGRRFVEHQRGDDLRRDRREQDAVAEVRGGDDRAISAPAEQGKAIAGGRPETGPVIEHLRA